jgi:hypothetical protein
MGQPINLMLCNCAVLTEIAGWLGEGARQQSQTTSKSQAHRPRRRQDAQKYALLVPDRGVN